MHNTTVYRVTARFRDRGECSLWDGREDNGDCKLTEVYLGILDEVVRSTPQNHGWRRPTWTRALLVKSMQHKTSVRINVGTTSRALALIDGGLGLVVNQAAFLSAHGGTDVKEKRIPFLTAAGRPCRAWSNAEFVFAQIEVFAEFAKILEQDHQSAIIGLANGLENQQGKELVLREVGLGEFRRIRGNGFFRQAIRRPRHGTRRLGHGASC